MPCHLACPKSYIAKRPMTKSTLKICKGIIVLKNLRVGKYIDIFYESPLLIFALVYKCILIFVCSTG